MLTKEYIYIKIDKNGNIHSSTKKGDDILKHYTIEEIYCAYHNIKPVICYCGNKTKFYTFKTGYADTCSIKCAHNKKKDINVTKEYIEEYLLNDKGELDSGKTKYYKESSKEMFMIYHNIKFVPKCRCGNDVNYAGFQLGFGNYCSKKCEFNERIETNNKYRVDYKKYCAIVNRVTKKQNISTLKNYQNRGRGQYHLDHKFSKKRGFLLNIPPWIVGSIYNLEFILESENTSKQSKCSITKNKLIKDFYENNKN